MRWKKNAISYICWFLYVLIIETLVLTCADSLGKKAGMSVYVSALLAFGYVALVGLVVLLIHIVLKKYASVGDKKKLLGFIAEAFFCVGLLAVGLFLRISNMDSMSQSAAYFETAQVTYGQSIPQVVHGAVYLYLQVLHGLFVLVGNHFAAGIWLQIGLQMLAFVVLYFVVRKMAGAIAAMFTLAFGMCAPVMVQYALTLSPEMLYFLLVVLSLGLFMSGCGRKLKPALFLLFGGIAAVLTYLDIAGVLLLIFVGTIPFIVREENCRLVRKMAALGCTVLSFAGVFVGSIFLDAFLCGKDFLNVLGAWAELYTFKPYIPSDISFMPEDVVIIAVLVVGIYSFWRNKQEEIISVSVLSILAAVVASYFFAAEMPGELYCMMLTVVLAGAFVGQMFWNGEKAVAVETDGSFISETDDGSIEGTDEFVMIENSEDTEFIDSSMDAEAVVEGTEPVQETAAPEEESPVPDAKPVIQFIENPLPLPKKHEKKVLDYAVELTDETVDFDVDVSDDDDYDV